MSQSELHLINTQSLGPMRRSFPAAKRNVVAGYVLGGLGTIGGLLILLVPANAVIQTGGRMVFWTDQKHVWSWGVVLIATVAALCVLAIGIAVLLYARFLSSSMIAVCDGGLCVVGRRGSRLIAWDDILSVEETHLSERPPLLKGAAKFVLPKLKSRSFAIAIRNQPELRFDGDRVKDHIALADLIKPHLDSRNVPWRIVEQQGY